MTTLTQLNLALIFLMISNAAQGTELMGEKKHELVVALGTADVFDSAKYGGYGIEYRYLPIWRKLRPIVGYSATREHDQYVYVGFRYFVDINEVWRFNPTFAVGLFDTGGGINLGGSVEFRSGFELSRRLNEKISLGLGISHLSNSRIYRSNPGTETVQLSLAIAL